MVATMLLYFCVQYTETAGWSEVQSGLTWRYFADRNFISLGLGFVCVFFVLLCLCLSLTSTTLYIATIRRVSFRFYMPTSKTLTL